MFLTPIMSVAHLRDIHVMFLTPLMFVAHLRDIHVMFRLH